MSAESYIPARGTLKQMRAAVQACEGCELFKRATQAVFGSGPVHAKLMLVGEQPGNEEDLEGEPFVGPAGRMLDDALQEAELDRKTVYLTNAVKHFKWEPSGSRRLHKKPSAREIRACHPWLKAEQQLVSPQGIVCLGATAAQALLGRDFRITSRRGTIIAGDAGIWFLATWHPAAILRSPDPDQRHNMPKEFIADLHLAAAALV